mgnify:CR=1 FL=1
MRTAAEVKLLQLHLVTVGLKRDSNVTRGTEGQLGAAAVGGAAG